ncbi:lipopolysaccharide biosynthesis protein [Iodidimonas sp. SYSU 1G8]|uniref:lipopolysaccharide biosynthesis protein n=1 Tax=Iodidimonas sp. SYSU 1G8 TaxID=3133967 RepID=UPI0031FE55A9
MSSDIEPMGKKVVAGSIWMIGLRWAMRLLGFVSTVILARLLTPDDFGLIAMGILASGFVTALTEAGSFMALIRHPDPQRVHYDTAWTFNVILGVGAAVAIAILSPLAPLYFDDPRLVEVLLIIALATAIAGFGNIGTMEFRRDFQFGRHFWFQFWPKLIGFIATVALAFIFRSYWALIWGILARSVAEVATSYMMHRYRPRFSLAARGELISFSLWTSFGSLGSFLEQRLDQFVLGGLVTPTRLGLYYLATNVAEMATRELVAPLNPVVYSVYSRIHDDPVRLVSAVTKALGAAALLGFAASLGLFALAEEFVLSVYGDQWSGATLLLQILALSALGACIRSVTAPLLVAQGRQRLTALMSWGQVAISAVLMPAAYWYAEIVGVAVSRSVIDIGVALAVMVLALSPHRGLFLAVLKVFGRLFLAAIVMVIAIRLSQSLLPLGPIASLCFNVPLGAAVYGIAVLLFWALSGRPQGVETEVLEHAGDYWSGFCRRFRRS